MSWILVLAAVALGVSTSARARQPSPTAAQVNEDARRALNRGVAFYTKRQYHAATVLLHRVLTSRGASVGLRERAEFFLGKALYHLQLYAASLTYFDRIVAKGSAHKYHAHTLVWLVALQEKLPLTAGVLNKIGKYPLSALDDPALSKVRNKLIYYLGRYYFKLGDRQSLDKAIKLFRMVR